MKLLAIIVLPILVVGCANEPVKSTGHPGWIPPDGNLSESDPDTLEHLMGVQRYAREHNGRLPPPGVTFPR